MKKIIMIISFLLFGSWLYILIISGINQKISKSIDWLSWVQMTELLSSISISRNPDLVYLVAWWDIMLSRNIWYLAKQEWYNRIFRPWNYNPILSFSWCIWENCVLFFNLESLFNENDCDFPKAWFTFRANTWNIQTLLQLKKNHTLSLSLANNHTVNSQYSWVILTRDLLAQNNVLYAGAGISTWESREFIQIEKNNIKLCIWAYSYDGDFLKAWAWKMAWNNLNESDMKSDLQKMIEYWCDVKIFSLHWWSEYRISPNINQKKIAHNLIDSWADLILWWHSHVPWEFEVYSGKYIFYSFWNFIFDQWWWKTTPGWNYDHIYDYSLKKNTVPTYIWLLAGLKIEKNDKKTKISLDDIKMTTLTDWILQPLDPETYSWILARIRK